MSNVDWLCGYFITERRPRTPVIDCNPLYTLGQGSVNAVWKQSDSANVVWI